MRAMAGGAAVVPPRPRLRSRNLRHRRDTGDRRVEPCGSPRTGAGACSAPDAALGSPTGARSAPLRFVASGPRVGDGVIGSPPAFGAVQSRFESESPSQSGLTRRPRRSVSPQETSPSTAPTVAAVVVLAAGQGTRMKSAIPKVLHALGGRTMLGHVLAAAE